MAAYIHVTFALVLTFTLSICYGDHAEMKLNVGFANFNPTTANADAIKKVLNDVIDTDHDVRIRPRVNQSHAVTVNVKFTPVNVVTLDTTEQRLDVLGYFTVTWLDELLAWNTSAYGGISVIQMPISQVWRPKLVLLKAFHSNNVIGDVKLDAATARMLEGVEGAEVHWVPEGIYSVLCELRVEFYPFDIQDCYLSLYVADESLLTVRLNGAARVSTAHYLENVEWKLLNVKSGMYTRYNTNVVYVDFRLERRAQFTLYTIMVPLLLLSVLDVAGFLIPVESGEKIGYMVTLFLTFGFFVFILRDGLPHNSLQVSYFLVLLMQLSFVSVFSVIYAILETRIFQSLGNKHVRFLTNRVDAKSNNRVDGKGSNRDDARGNNRNNIEEGSGNTKAARAKSGKGMNVHSASNRADTNTKGANKSKDNRAVSSREVLLESGGQAEPVTWGEFLRKLDFVMCAVFSVLVFIFSLFFFATVLNR